MAIQQAVWSVLLMAGVAAPAFAQSGDITFNGEVTTTTCDVSFNGKLGENPVIVLPTVADTSLRMGNSAGRTPVHVHIGGTAPGCASGGVTMRFDPAHSASLLNGRLVNTAATAAAPHVVIGLRDDRDQVIDLGAGWISPVVSLLPGGADMLFHAEYYADGGDAQSGLVQASLQYTLSYQ